MSVLPVTPHLQSRLPNVGTTIFTVMSALAAEKGAVNLGQGFPDFHCDPKLTGAVTEAMGAGHNQYPPMTGIPALRQAISRKIESLYGRHYDEASEITVTAGATQAILTAILAVVHPATRSSCSSPAMTATCPTSNWPAASSCACLSHPAAFGRTSARLPRR